MNVDPSTTLLVVYIANIIIAGYVGGASLFFPGYSAESLFDSTVTSNDAIRLIGAFWASIALLSIAGLSFPVQMSPILCVQLIYKGLWLLVVALPLAVRNNHSILPTIMTIVFIVYVIVLPFVIPFNYILGM